MRLLLPLLVLLAACTNAPRIMTWAEYDALDHAAPYLIERQCGAGRLIYVGSRHTNDPAHAQNALIEELWRQLEPQIALNEGGNPPTYSDRDQAIRMNGEAGLVRYLAGRDKVPVKSIDPPRRLEVQWLLETFDAGRVKTYFALLQVNHHRRNPVEPFDQLMTRVFRNLESIPELAGVKPMRVEDLEVAYDDVQAWWFDPMRQDHWTNQVSRASSNRRDRFMIEQIHAALRDGKRVFAVVGASHVVMQEPVIRSLRCAR